jgi:hypothetical protein
MSAGTDRLLVNLPSTVAMGCFFALPSLIARAPEAISSLPSFTKNLTGPESRTLVSYPILSPTFPGVAGS